MSDIPPTNPTSTLSDFDFWLRFTCFIVPIFAPFFVWAFYGSDDPIPYYVLAGWDLTFTTALGVCLGAKSPRLKGAAKAMLWGSSAILLAFVLFFAFIDWVGFGLGD